MNIRNFVSWARDGGELVEIERAVDPHLEKLRRSTRPIRNEDQPRPVG